MLGFKLNHVSKGDHGGMGVGVGVGAVFHMVLQNFIRGGGVLYFMLYYVLCCDYIAHTYVFISVCACASLSH